MNEIKRARQVPRQGHGAVDQSEGYRKEKPYILLLERFYFHLKASVIYSNIYMLYDQHATFLILSRQLSNNINKI